MLGGLPWRLYGYRATFLGGAATVAASLALTQWVRCERAARQAA